MEEKLELSPIEVCFRIYRIIKKRIWLIIIIILITTSIAGIMNIYLASPTYESSVQLLVRSQNKADVSDDDASIYQIIFQTYKDIAGTNKVAEIAADKIGNGTKASDLLNRTTITASPGTMIINIKVKSSTAEGAYKDAQVYSEAFVERAKDLNLSSGGIEIVDEAELPGSPVESNAKKKIIMAFLLGLIASVILVFFLDYMDTYKDKIKNNSRN